MKKVMALFAALILFVGCSPVEAEGVLARFNESWINAYSLGDEHAWVLDRDGTLWKWEYDENEPTQMATLPVYTREMFMDYSKPYRELPLANQKQIDETVTLLAEDGDTLYALNQYSGNLWVVAQGKLQKTSQYDSQSIWLESGNEAACFGKVVINHKLYLLFNCWEEAPNFILEIDLSSGKTRKMSAPQAYRMAPCKGQLLLACGDEDKSATIKRMDIESGQITDLHLETPASEALAYDAVTDTIYSGNDSGIYISQEGGAFRLTANLPCNFLWGDGTITRDGRYVFFSGGIWVMPLIESAGSKVLHVRAQSTDPVLISLFTAAYPDVLLDLQEDWTMTAADVGDYIRSGDNNTDIFSVTVDSAFGSMVHKGYVSPMKNEDILLSVKRMYQGLSDCLLDDQGQVIAYPWDVNVHGMWEVNDTLWKKHFGNAAYPVTWQAFFSRMLEFESMENEDNDLFLTYWDYEWMIKQVLTAFIVSREQAGISVDFTDKALLDTLTVLSQVRKALMDRGVETYDEAEVFWESEVIGEHSIFSTGQAYSSHSAYMGLKNALPPFTFAEDDKPVYQGGMRVLIVNPLSQRKELAESFIAMLSQQEYSPMHWYLLHTDAVEPFDQKPYHITEQDIAAWQAIVEAASFSNHSVLVSDALDEQINPLVSRYAAGQMNLQTMLQKLNDIARMIEYELQ